MIEKESSRLTATEHGIAFNWRLKYIGEMVEERWKRDGSYSNHFLFLTLSLAGIVSRLLRILDSVYAGSLWQIWTKRGEKLWSMGQIIAMQGNVNNGMNKSLGYLRIKWFNCNAAVSLQENVGIRSTGTWANADDYFAVGLHNL